MVVLIVAVILALVFLTWTLCRAPRSGTPSPNGFRRAVLPRKKEVVCDGSHVHRVRFRRAGLPRLLSPFLYAARRSSRWPRTCCDASSD